MPTPAEKCCIMCGYLNAIYIFKLDVPKTNLFVIFSIFYGFEFFADAGVVKTLDSRFRVPFMSLRLPPLLSGDNLKSCTAAVSPLADTLLALLYAQRSIEEWMGSDVVDDLVAGLNATSVADNGNDTYGG